MTLELQKPLPWDIEEGSIEPGWEWFWENSIVFPFFFDGNVQSSVGIIEKVTGGGTPPPTLLSGLSGRGFEFPDGTTNFELSSTFVDDHLSSAGTIVVCWGHDGVTEATNAYLFGSRNTETGWELRINTDNEINLGIENTVGGGFGLVGSGALSAGTRVASATWDGENASVRADGQTRETVAFSGTVSQQLTPQIGKHPLFTTVGLRAGRPLYWIAFLQKAATVEQEQQLFRSPFGPFHQRTDIATLTEALEIAQVPIGIVGISSPELIMFD